MDALHTDIRTFVIDNFLFGQDGQLGNDDSFLDTGIIDSTGVLELVGFLEKRFDIAIEDDELVPDNLDSVTRIARFVERKLQAKGERHAG
ncbi:MAG: acyl carrier protein [Vicinamibacterales bacterium]